MPTVYEQLITRVKETSLLASAAGLLSWDQETMMPAKGLTHRGEQIALLSRMVHEKATDPVIDEWLSACEQDNELVGDPISVSAVNIREIRRAYDKATKLPAKLVEEMAHVTTHAKHEWVKARQSNEYERFRPWLEKIVHLTKRKAECYGWPKDGEAWDALADDYEPGCTAASVANVFAPLRSRLVQLVARIREKGDEPVDVFADMHVPTQRQDKFVRYVAAQIGFDFEAGRLDTSAHPFCSGDDPGDVRLTTRYREHHATDALFGTMHEAGHGIYTQGLPHEHAGTPIGSPVGLSIHESQSRLWENFIGRSRVFWQWCLPTLKEHFGDQTAKLNVDDVFASVNRVKPDLTRVEADEATYNLHIMVRFELERALMNGDITAADLPLAWNERYSDYLAVRVPDDARGCMQDIHWSMGAIGYFPTYTMGNLFAAQFFEKAAQDLNDLPDQIARGEFIHLKHWLNTHIHQQGQRYRSDALCEHVTGKPLSAEPLLRHLESKLGPIYGL